MDNKHKKNEGRIGEFLFMTLPNILMAAVFFIATLPLSTDFYTALRYIVFIYMGWSILFSFFFMGFTDSAKLTFSVIAIKVAIMVIFNPYIPFYLSKGVWVVIDIICAAILIILAIGKTIYLAIDELRIEARKRGLSIIQLIEIKKMERENNKLREDIHKRITKDIPDYVLEHIESYKGEPYFLSEVLNDCREQGLITKEQADYLYELYKE